MRAADKVTAGLRDYARQAMEVKPGPDLFGKTADETTARAILHNVTRNAASEPDARGGGVDASERPSLLDVREPGGGRDGPGSAELRPLGERSAAPDLIQALNDRFHRKDAGPVDIVRPPGPDRATRAEQAARGTELDLTDDAATIDVESARRQLSAAGLTGVDVGEAGPHGPVLSGLGDRWEEAVHALTTLRSGDAVGALTHPETGPIDVVWGDAKSGLEHILAKHPEVTRDLPERLAKMTLASRSDNRVVLESDADRAVVRRAHDGAEKTWLLTAYEKDRPDGGTTETTTPSDPDRSPDQSATPSLSEEFISRDPELAALQADTERLAKQNALALPEQEPSEQPESILQAIQAAAVCLLGGGE